MLIRRRLRAAALTTALAMLAPIGAAASGAAAEAGDVPATADGPSETPDPTDPEQVNTLLDEVIPEQLEEHQIPGASVVVVAGGEQVTARGYGVSDTEEGTPVQPDETAFFMASVAKVFTATAVMQLVEQGRLDLHTDVNEYLTDMKIENTYPGRPVTLHHLLTHTAGFDYALMGRSVNDAEDAADLGASLAEHQPERVRPPGEVSSYDNYGVALAGYIVEEVSSEPYADYVREHILEPLDMTGSSFGQPYPARDDTALARGHRPAGDEQVTASGQYGDWQPTGSGAVATATDMARFLLAHLGRGKPADQRVLGEDAAGAMQERQFGNDERLPGLGYIFEEQIRSGERLLVKSGDLPGFHSNIAMVPERGVGVYVVYNGDGAGVAGGHTAEELVNRVVDHFYPADTTPTPTPVDDVDSEAFAGEYRSSTTNRSDIMRAAALTGSVSVQAGEDGTLVTDGPLGTDPDVSTRHWVPLGDGVFQDRDGQARIAFERDEDGNATALTTSAQPTAKFERLNWNESGTNHQMVLIAAVTVIIVSMLGWAVNGVVRRARSHGPASRGARSARLVAGITALLVTAMVGCFAVLVSDPNAMNEAILLGDSPLLWLVPVLGALAAVGAVGTVVGSVLAWTRGWWHPLARLHFTGAAVALVLFVSVAAEYNLVGVGSLVANPGVLG